MQTEPLIGCSNRLEGTFQAVLHWGSSDQFTRLGASLLGLFLLGSCLLGCGRSQTDPGPSGDAPSFRDVLSRDVLFRDVPSAESGLDARHDNGGFGGLTLVEIMGPGGALLDYDQDGDLDVYVVQGHALDPARGESQTVERGDRLFRNDLDQGRPLRFTDVTSEVGLAAHGYGLGVAVGDVDQDGLPDVYLAQFGANELWRTVERDGAYSLVRTPAGVEDPGFSVGASFLDFDGDGWPDLYVAEYVEFDVERDRPCRSVLGVEDYCSPVSFSPSADRLYRNIGLGEGLRFEDVSRSAGISAERKNGLGVLATDLDEDGRPDLLVANDQHANLVWHNLADGRFEEAAVAAGLAVNGQGVMEASMGIAAGDLDDDGDEDLLLSHLKAETHTLYARRGPLYFEDRTLESGLGGPTLPSTGFGAAFLDADLDGRLDLLVVNGAVGKLEELVRADDPHPLHQPDQLFLRADSPEPESPPRFVEGSALGGRHFERSEVGRGLAVGDLDNDGDEDALIFNNHGPVRLLESLASERSAWIGVAVLDQRVGGGHAVGVRVEIELANGERKVRWPRRDGSYASSRDPRAVVGLGPRDSARIPKSLRAVWPDGHVEVLESPELDRYHVLLRTAQ